MIANIAVCVLIFFTILYVRSRNSYFEKEIQILDEDLNEFEKDMMKLQCVIKELHNDNVTLKRLLEEKPKRGRPKKNTKK